MNKKISTPSFYGIFVCALGALFYCYEYLLRIEPSVMVPELMHSFQINAQGFGWLIAMYYYAYTPMQAVVGISTDYLGPRKVLVTALALCAGGCFLFGLGGNVVLAGTGRFMMGMGSAFAFVCALKLAAVWLAEEYFAIFVGLTTALGMSGAMAGDVVMSKVVQDFGWEHVLIYSAIIGVALIPVFWFGIRDNNKDAKSNLERPHTIKNLLNGLWTMIGNRQIWFCGIIGCMLFLSLSAFAEIWGIPFMNCFENITPVMAAKLNSMVFLGWLIGSPIAGWVSNKLRSRRIPLIVGSLLAALMISIVLYVKIEGFWNLAILLFLFGVFCSAENLCFAIVRENTPLHLAATAIGFTNMLIMLGGMITQPLVGIILDISWKGAMNHGIRSYDSFDYHLALSLIPMGMVVAAILGLFLKESYHK